MKTGWQGQHKYYDLKDLWKQRSGSATQTRALHEMEIITFNINNSVEFILTLQLTEFEKSMVINFLFKKE